MRASALVCLARVRHRTRGPAGPGRAVTGMLDRVHGIIAAHSSGLLIDSRLGEGTRVSLYLPSR